ncbi:HNH endonuclease [Nocardioides sp. Bht2]|uniref:HNH endonuclease n=1 Tax=Nocardioides sp. Bht2 TaxID=3392297 RepID=UPI0039B68E5C
MSISHSLLVREVQALRARLSAGGCGHDATELIELIGSLEELKSAACAVQAEASAVFDEVRRKERALAAVPAVRQGSGIASEIALARKESPHRGRTLLGMSKALTAEMPHTLARLRDGSLSEYRAQILVKETACLSRADRRFVDEEICADPAALTGLGNRDLNAKVRRLAVEIDPAAVVERARRAEADRHASVRPAPDTMGYLTFLMPIPQAVAAYAAVRKASLAARAAGDPRSLGQLMCDLALSRLTGLPDTGSPEQAPAVPVSLNLTMTASTLAGGHAPATLTASGIGQEVLPAEIARLLASRAISTGVGAWFRRLTVSPVGGLVSMSAKQRFFPSAMAEFLAIRGAGICSTPYCNAPIRHFDHIRSFAAGGTTDAINGQGLCEACNHAKQVAGWRQRVINAAEDRQEVETITLTGHRYVSRVPEPPGWREPRFRETHPGFYALTS